MGEHPKSEPESWPSLSMIVLNLNKGQACLLEEALKDCCQSAVTTLIRVRKCMKKNCLLEINSLDHLPTYVRKNEEHFVIPGPTMGSKLCSAVKTQGN